MTSNQQTQALNEVPDYNSGINSLPAFQGDNPDDYAPLTGASDFRPPPQATFVPTAPAAPIPRATPVDDWRNSAIGNRPNYPAPGTPISYPAPGTPSTTTPIESQQGFFARLLDSIRNGISGVGDIFGHPHPDRTAQTVGGGGLIMSNRTFNSYRSPFSPTYQQLASPGSAIGPLSGAVTNPFVDNGMPLGAHGAHTTAAPGYATVFSNAVKARNIA